MHQLMLTAQSLHALCLLSHRRHRCFQYWSLMNVLVDARHFLRLAQLVPLLLQQPPLRLEVTVSTKMWCATARVLPQLKGPALTHLPQHWLRCVR
jgi:hypothetical protein